MVKNQQTGLQPDLSRETHTQKSTDPGRALHNLPVLVLGFMFGPIYGYINGFLALYLNL